ncbi:MAG: hypothetical protein LBG64_01700 [Pseudomonadales bacterium]|nr:hypothetical protein [Pseudomonadales bacterium]
MCVKEFAKKNGLVLTASQINQETNHFVEEMRRALKGEASSLMALPSYLTVAGNLNLNSSPKLLCIDAGGTNLRVRLVQFVNGQLKILEDRRDDLPGITETIGVEEFFKRIMFLVAPFAGIVDKIGFCFSFPAEILPSQDGKIIKFTKDVKVENATNCLVGNELRRALKLSNLPHHHQIVILNDTVAALLGGTAQHHGSEHFDYAGQILGTGTNTAVNIAKGDLTGAINFETGGYKPRFCASKIDLAFLDKACENSKNLFELMIAGQNQGTLFLAYLKEAAKHNLFSKKTANELLKFEYIDSCELDRFYHMDSCGNTFSYAIIKSKKDGEAFRSLLKIYFERIAQLVLINWQAVRKILGEEKQLVMALEGTVGTKSRLFQSTFNPNENEFLVERLNNTIAGTALAALMAKTH